MLAASDGTANAKPHRRNRADFFIVLQQLDRDGERFVYILKAGKQSRRITAKSLTNADDGAVFEVWRSGRTRTHHDGLNGPPAECVAAVGELARAG